MSNRLLPVGSSGLEIAAANAAAVICRVPMPLRYLWNPLDCPVELLPYLAWALSVDRWEESWTEGEKRRAVQDAFYIHQHKGTLSAIRRVINNMGYAMTLKEWWQVSDAPGTFRLSVDVGETGMSERVFNELERIVGDARPVSRHISQLTISAAAGSPVYIGAAMTDADNISVFPADYTPLVAAVYDGNAHYDGAITHSTKEQNKWQA